LRTFQEALWQATLPEVVQEPPPQSPLRQLLRYQYLIDYTTKVGMMIYDEGCAKLTTEFNMKSSGTVVYTTKLQAKCVKMGWHMGTQQIINFTNAAGSTINIVHQYGQIDVATLQA
jgi:hypothetical protein